MMTNEDTPQGPPDPPAPESPPPPPPASTPPPPPPEDRQTQRVTTGVVSENRTIWTVLSYLGPLALIPLLVEREDSEVQWHAKHGLVLMVTEIVVIIALQIVVMMIGAISGGLGCLLGLLFPLLFLAILVLHVVCIVRGVNGERFTIAGISDFADRF
jgi:uncharacterized membrane protein